MLRFPSTWLAAAVLTCSAAGLAAQETGADLDALFEPAGEEQDPASQRQAPDAPPLDLGQMPGFLGSSRSGYLTRFSTEWNPAIGVVFDVLAEFADVPRSKRYNTVRARNVELDIASRIDPLGWAYAVVAFADNTVEREAELEEAAIWMDELPGNFSVRAGRYLADFGKWNSLHTHDKPYVNEDEVRREFFGGPLFVTGAEVHHWFGIGDVPVRWSIGMAADAEGEDHDPGAGAEEAMVPFLGRQGIDNWAGTARLTGQHDVGQNGYFQWGLSGFYTPGAVELEQDMTTLVVTRSERRKAVAAADLTFRAVDATTQSSETVSVEVWYDHSQFTDGASILRSEGHGGAWGFYEHAFSPSWAAGAVGSWVQSAESVNASGFLTGGPAEAVRGAFVTWNLTEFNRLRLQVAHSNPGLAQEKFWSVAVQWAVILGSHTHPVDW